MFNIISTIISLFCILILFGIVDSKAIETFLSLITDNQKTIDYIVDAYKPIDKYSAYIRDMISSIIDVLFSFLDESAYGDSDIKESGIENKQKN